jgi:hypothetical protein
MGALRGANSILYDRGIMWPSSFSGADVEFPPQHGPKDTCPLQASHRKVWGFGVFRGFPEGTSATGCQLSGGSCEGELVYFNERRSIGPCRREIRSAEHGLWMNLLGRNWLGRFLLGPLQHL